MGSLETHKACGDLEAATTGKETESVMCTMALLLLERIISI